MAENNDISRGMIGGRCRMSGDNCRPPRLTTDALLISSNEQLVELLVLRGRVEYDEAKFKAASLKHTKDVSVI